MHRVIRVNSEFFSLMAFYVAIHYVYLNHSYSRFNWLLKVVSKAYFRSQGWQNILLLTLDIILRGKGLIKYIFTVFL